ncbi:MAG: nucleotidyltransferase family protein [Phycisphaerales bacterium]|jgi:molybdenum cofactor cytidylyltransferase|nr:nucleotidyltransferase family protein [Phycisphaerales bacterium]
MIFDRPVGLLLAAGRSQRMGTQTKQLLPWPPGDSRTMIEASFDLISGCCESMFVVLDHDAASIIAALGGRSFTQVQGDALRPMFESVRSGVRSVRSEHGEVPVLLHPADHPAVSSDTIRSVVEAGAAHPGKAIVPRCDERGGHPVLIPASLLRPLLNYNGEGGLRRFLAARPACSVSLEVDDHAMVLDVDSPSDYDRLGGQPLP